MNQMHFVMMQGGYMTWGDNVLLTFDMPCMWNERESGTKTQVFVDQRIIAQAVYVLMGYTV